MAAAFPTFEKVEYADHAANFAGLTTRHGHYRLKRARK
jgi:hypothetical protein